MMIQRLLAVHVFLQRIVPVVAFQYALLKSHEGVQRPVQQLQMSGYGITDGYTWKEEAFEIEVTVQLPRGTTGKDVHFTPGPTSMDLRVDTPDGKQLVLLDGQRKLRGRISLDGTYWVFSDRRRSISVTLEKHFSHSNDDMQVLDYDWKGIYPNDEDEVTEREYDEPEVLDIREYASSLGVDVDNINRSMVDETMFSSGLNLTQRALDQLSSQGYLTEVTQQKDGSEYRTNPETGEPEPFSFSNDDARIPTGDPKRVNIPFIDTNSPWHQAVPVSVDLQTNKTTIADEHKLKESLNQNARLCSESEDTGSDNDDDGKELPVPNKPSDPIELLTVKKLRDVLRKQGLKVSGSKKELQERIRDHVNSLLHALQAKDKEGSQP